MTRPLVLVAEDDPGIRMTIGVVLEDEDYDLVFAAEGDKALELARSRLPDLILLDRKMPGMDGRDVFLALQESTATRDIPVLVLSGMSPGAESDWPGAQFVTKPFDPDDLIERVRAALTSSKS